MKRLGSVTAMIRLTGFLIFLAVSIPVASAAQDFGVTADQTMEKINRAVREINPDLVSQKVRCVAEENAVRCRYRSGRRCQAGGGSPA